MTAPCINTSTTGPAGAMNSGIRAVLITASLRSCIFCFPIAGSGWMNTTSTGFASTASPACFICTTVLNKAFTSYDDYFDDSVDEEAMAYLALANELIHAVRPEALTIAEDVSGMPGLAARRRRRRLRI